MQPDNDEILHATCTSLGMTPAKAVRGHGAALRWLASDLADADEIVAIWPVVALIGTHRQYAAAISAVGWSALGAGGGLIERLGANVVTGDVHQALAVAPAGPQAVVRPRHQFLPAQRFRRFLLRAAVSSDGELLRRVASPCSGAASSAAGALVGDSHDGNGATAHWRTRCITWADIAGERARLRRARQAGGRNVVRA
jgi:hypothetical protein